MIIPLLAFGKELLSQPDIYIPSDFDLACAFQWIVNHSEDASIIGGGKLNHRNKHRIVHEWFAAPIACDKVNSPFLGALD